MHRLTPTRTSLLTAGLLPTVLVLSALGCKSDKDTGAEGSTVAAGQPASVDRSWITAAESCWPAIRQSGRSTADIERYLVNPAHLRSVFPTYAALSDAQIQTDLTLPIATILPPDITKLAHSQRPVLTRGQAATGTGPQGAIVARTDGSAPPDSLCSIQTGTPVAFE